MNNQYNRYYTFIKPIIRNTTVRTYSTLVFNIIAITIFIIFAIQPTIVSILARNKTISQQQKILDQLNTKANNLFTGKQNLSKIDPTTLTKLNTLLPNKTDITTLTSSLANTALAHEASVSGLQIQPIDLVGEPVSLSKKPTLQEVDFTFNLTGTYSQLMDTLNDLANTQRIISIDSINFNQPQQGNLLMSITAKTYYLKN